MRKNFTIFMIALLVALLSGTVSAQRLAVKSNLLYDITSTINLGVEYEVAPRWTLEMSVNYNPWSFSDNKKMKLWMLQPEARYWLCSGFSGHFFARTETAVVRLSPLSSLSPLTEPSAPVGKVQPFRPTHSTHPTDPSTPDNAA